MWHNVLRSEYLLRTMLGYYHTELQLYYSKTDQGTTRPVGHGSHIKFVLLREKHCLPPPPFVSGGDDGNFYRSICLVCRRVSREALQTFQARPLGEPETFALKPKGSCKWTGGTPGDKPAAHPAAAEAASAGQGRTGEGRVRRTGVKTATRAFVEETRGGERKGGRHEDEPRGVDDGKDREWKRED